MPDAPSLSRGAARGGERIADQAAENFGWDCDISLYDIRHAQPLPRSRASISKSEISK